MDSSESPMTIYSPLIFGFTSVIPAELLAAIMLAEPFLYTYLHACIGGARAQDRGCR